MMNGMNWQEVNITLLLRPKIIQSHIIAHPLRKKMLSGLTIKAVSYTHLDVYKRQLMTGVIKEFQSSFIDSR